MALPRKAPLSMPNTATLGTGVPGACPPAPHIPVVISSLRPAEDWPKAGGSTSGVGRRLWARAAGFTTAFPDPEHLFLSQSLRCSAVHERG